MRATTTMIMIFISRLAIAVAITAMLKDSHQDLPVGVVLPVLFGSRLQAVGGGFSQERLRVADLLKLPKREGSCERHSVDRQRHGHE